MASFLDVCRFTAVSTGTGDFVVSAAATGYQTPASAQATDAAIYKYRAESADLSQWEVGYGAYTVSSTTLARTTVLYNSSGTQSKISFSAAPQVAIVGLAEDLSPIDGALFGLTLSTAGSSATFTTAAGWAADSTAVNILRLYASLAKTTSAWAVGATNGSLDTGAIANTTWYHVYIIKRLDTGVTDILTSLSATAPTMPTNYTLKRRIGAMKTDGSAHWVLFVQTGDRFRWATPVLDVSNTSFAAYISTAVSSPLGVQCVAFGNLVAGTGGSIINIRPVGASDAVPATTATPLAVNGMSASGNSIYTNWRELTDTSSQISIAGNTTIGTYLATVGWEDTRGRLF
jgi:hypothetical protein